MQVFTARRYASAVYAVVLCLSVTSRSSTETLEGIVLAFGVETTLGLSYIALKGNSGISRNKDRLPPSGTLSQTLNWVEFLLFLLFAKACRSLHVVNLVRPTTVASLSH